MSAETADSLSHAMERAERCLVTLLAGHGDDDFPLALQFGLDVGTIGRALVSRPEIEPRVAAFVGRTEALVDRCVKIGLWHHRVARAADNRSSETLEYTNALAMRSDLEFFRTLYRGTKARFRVEELETADIDEELRQWGAVQYLEEIPADIPASHVWWHQSLSGL